ncbi:hypothetical protein TWF696_000837 [Orbilia brochopaga]|uniref:SCD domain-containing protein n=1 Tax=Orbilia brochopaga TaxID=3140254 RepID=A0AAV9VIU9_9PEZI
MSATTSTQTPTSTATTTSLTIIGRMATVGEDSATPEPSGESSQRRSTRVRRPPTTYSPPPTTQRKRKRDSRVGAADNASEDEEAAASDDDAELQSDATGASDEEQDEASEDESTNATPASRKRPNSKSKSAAPSRSKAAKTPAKKPVPKKSRTDAGPQVRAKATPRKRNKVVNGVVELDGDDLFNRVLAGEDASKIVQDWIDTYDSDNTDAMVAMINFILRSCGCNQSVTSDDIEDADSAASKLEDIQEIFQKEFSVEYPIASRSQKYRRYRACLTAFFAELISHLSASGVLTGDPALIENMQIWITAMSSSPLRPFRHTSTAINLSIMTALCSTMADIEKTINNTTKQLESEKSKARKNAGRIKSLEATIKEVQESQDFITDQISDIYESIFVHRYRDVDAKIRAECIHELGIWIMKLPSIFFEASYLRYLGWVLSDTAVNVRSEVIKALARLFKDRANVGGLRNFTDRFRSRLVEMALQDADSGVRAEAIALLNEIRQVGFLEADDIESIGRLLYDADAKVRGAVADFFASNVQEGYDEQIEDCGGEDTVKEALQTAGDLDDEEFEGHQISWIKFKCLVNSLSAYDQDDSTDTQAQETNAKGIAALGLQSRFQLAGLALYKAIPELHKWEDLAKYLLYDHTGNQMNNSDDETLSYVKRFCTLKAKEENILLHVLHASISCAIAAAADATAIPARSKRKLSEAPDEEDISRSLAHYVPLLLNKFGPPPETAATVLRIAQLMKLDVYQELRQMNTYTLLLDSAIRQFMTHLDEAVLKEASGFLLHAKSFDELDEVTSQKITAVQEEVSNYLVSLVSGKDLEKGEIGDQALSDLETAVKRLQYLASVTDCKEVYELNAPAASHSAKGKGKKKEAGGDAPAVDAPVEILTTIIGRGKNSDEAENELWLSALKSLLYYFMWNVESVTKNSPSTDRAADEHLAQLETLREREKAITGHLETLINVRELDEVRIAAAGALLDFHTFNALLATSTRPHMFPRRMSVEVQEDILRVYISAEKRFAKLTNKTVAFGSDDEADDEENTDLEAALLFEQRLCEFVGKITLAVLGEVVDPTIFKARLLKNKSQLGPNIREILNHLDPPKPRPSRAKPKAKPVTNAIAGKQMKSAEVIEDSDDEERNEQEAHEEDIVRHDEMVREEEEEHEKRQASVVEDEDEEMVDAD